MSTFNDIARYAEGEMTTEERSAFETTLAADENLQRQLALYHEVHAGLKQHFHTDEQQSELQATLQTLRGEFFTTAATPAKVVNIKKYLRAAVAVAAVLLIAVFIWQPWQPSLFIRYADTSMVAPAERGSNVDNLLQQAVDAFNKKDFPIAMNLLEQIQKQDTASAYINFYYGVALLQTGKLPAAQTIFMQLYAGESTFKYEAAYYQALVHLKQNNKKACADWLNKIPVDATNYARARELLGKL